MTTNDLKWFSVLVKRWNEAENGVNPRGACISCVIQSTRQIYPSFSYKGPNALKGGRCAWGMGTKSYLRTEVTIAQLFFWSHMWLIPVMLTSGYMLGNYKGKKESERRMDPSKAW